MTDLDYDFIVIGGGPAGQKAAIQAAKEGLSVTLVERDRQIGGACVHRGTIPSKTLREQIIRLDEFKRRCVENGIEVDPEVQIPHLLQRLQGVIHAHSDYMHHQIERNGIDYRHGQASFVDEHTIDVLAPDGRMERLHGRFIVVATGTRPRNPDGVLIDHEHVYDSDSILSMIYVPTSLVVIGAGVIAAEYASMLAVLGTRVTIVDKGERPLGFLDEELTDRFLETFSHFGGRFLPGTTVDEIALDPVSGVRCRLMDGQTLESEKVLFALGRVANIEGLRLENTGIRTTPRRLIEVDEHFRTSVEHIYAVGDIIGPPALASTSMEQGRQAVLHALGRPSAHLARTIPVGIYTIPELASVGLDEATARREHGPVVVGRARFEEIARGQISGIQNGVLKLVVAADTKRILGVHIAGEGAAELIHIGQIAILKAMRYDELVENIFNFPTLAEAYRVAALDVDKQLASSETTLEGGQRRRA